MGWGVGEIMGAMKLMYNIGPIEIVIMNALLYNEYITKKKKKEQPTLHTCRTTGPAQCCC
jgi:hypothetical protein